MQKMMKLLEITMVIIFNHGLYLYLSNTVSQVEAAVISIPTSITLYAIWLWVKRKIFATEE